MASRRTFLKQSALASSLLFVPNFLRSFAGAPTLRDSNGRRLVVIQLGGGNDGLNTVVPYENDLYYKARPVIGLSAREVLPLGQGLGLHPQLSHLREHFGQGQVAIFNNVGYPNPNRSHFRSMDIWHSACDSDGLAMTGWLGRYLDASPVAHPYEAIEVDDLLSLAMKGANRSALAVSTPEKFRRAATDPLFMRLGESWHPSDAPADGELAYLYKTLIDTSSSAEYLFQKTKITATRQLEYPRSRFGQHLHTLASLINAGLETRVYYAALPGFDTHGNQLNIQNRLFAELSAGLDAFICDLKDGGNWSDTLIMVFSEFGRRVTQNASGGTDHGTANNVFFLSGSLKQPGIQGEAPDLTDLDIGDLRHRLDFRALYATVLRDWLGADDELILGRKFDRVKLV